MRIAIANWSFSKVGGVETYLNTILPEFENVGCTVALISEVDESSAYKRIVAPRNSPSWCVSKIGLDRVLDLLRKWNADLIFCNGLNSSTFETELLRAAPSVFFAHGHYGICVSGSKTWRFPRVAICSQSFGWQCLVHYYPHRCGGLNPITALNAYRRESSRLARMQECRAVIVGSEYMRREYLRNGLPPSRIHTIPLPVSQVNVQDRSVSQPRSHNGERVDLLFVGRMHPLKGGNVLLEALPIVSQLLQRPVRLVFAGDGTEFPVWQQLARRIEGKYTNVRTEFVGWVNHENIGKLFDSVDLLAVPSLWPETFGLVGPEAGFHGVPAVAFDVGGITEWLSDGINGHVASGDPATPEGLAKAIAKCFESTDSYQRLREGARRMARRFTVERHMSSLVDLFANILGKDLPTTVGDMLVAKP